MATNEIYGGVGGWLEADYPFLEAADAVLAYKNVPVVGVLRHRAALARAVSDALFLDSKPMEKTITIGRGAELMATLLAVEDRLIRSGDIREVMGDAARTIIAGEEVGATITKQMRREIRQFAMAAGLIKAGRLTLKLVDAEQSVRLNARDSKMNLPLNPGRVSEYQGVLYQWPLEVALTECVKDKAMIPALTEFAQDYALLIRVGEYRSALERTVADSKPVGLIESRVVLTEMLQWASKESARVKVIHLYRNGRMGDDDVVKLAVEMLAVAPTGVAMKLDGVKKLFGMSNPLVTCAMFAAESYELSVHTREERTI